MAKMLLVSLDTLSDRVCHEVVDLLDKWGHKIGVLHLSMKANLESAQLVGVEDRSGEQGQTGHDLRKILREEKITNTVWICASRERLRDIEGIFREFHDALRPEVGKPATIYVLFQFDGSSNPANPSGSADTKDEGSAEAIRDLCNALPQGSTDFPLYGLCLVGNHSSNGEVTKWPSEVLQRTALWIASSHALLHSANLADQLAAFWPRTGMDQPSGKDSRFLAFGAMRSELFDIARISEYLSWTIGGASFRAEGQSRDKEAARQSVHSLAQSFMIPIVEKLGGKEFALRRLGQVPMDSPLPMSAAVQKLWIEDFKVRALHFISEGVDAWYAAARDHAERLRGALPEGYSDVWRYLGEIETEILSERDPGKRMSALESYLSGLEDVQRKAALPKSPIMGWATRDLVSDEELEQSVSHSVDLHKHALGKFVWRTLLKRLGLGCFVTSVPAVGIALLPAIFANVPDFGTQFNLRFLTFWFVFSCIALPILIRLFRSEREDALADLQNSLIQECFLPARERCACWIRTSNESAERRRLRFLLHNVRARLEGWRRFLTNLNDFKRAPETGVLNLESAAREVSSNISEISADLFQSFLKQLKVGTDPFSAFSSQIQAPLRIRIEELLRINPSVDMTKLMSYLETLNGQPPAINLAFRVDMRATTRRTMLVPNALHSLLSSRLKSAGFEIIGVSFLSDSVVQLAHVEQLETKHVRFKYGWQ